VFDATQQKVVKYLPVAGAGALIAAGSEKLFIVAPGERAVQRWDLKTFEKEKTVLLEGKETIKSVLMGSASNGPLWLVEERRAGIGGRAVTALDPQTLRPLDLKKDPKSQTYGVGEGMRVSADGSTLGTWRFGTSPSGFTVITLADDALKFRYEHSSVGHLTPSPDGKVIYTANGRFTPDGKSAGEQDGGSTQRGQGLPYCFPAADGSNLYLVASLSSSHGTNLPGNKTPIQLTARWGTDGEKLADLPEVPIETMNGWDREAIGNDQRFMLIPSAKLLVVLSSKYDKLLLFPFDLDAVLAKSGKDYLLAESPRVARAVRGETFSQSLTIRSKKGGVKVKLESGPDGLTVTPDGKVTWAVPKDFAEKDVSVLLTISDASGKELLHTFKLAVNAASETRPRD
jgi:hypothetical protein